MQLIAHAFVSRCSLAKHPVQDLSHAGLCDDCTPTPLLGVTRHQQKINLQRLFQQPYDDVGDVLCKCFFAGIEY